MSNRIEIGHGLALQFTTTSASTVPSDVWLQFTGADGKSAALSIAAQAEKPVIISAGLRSWASDRINEYMAAKITAEDAAREKSDGGQFGMGA